jgi:hypothetical protein
MAIDENKLNEFMGKFVGDLGAVMHAATIVVGDTLGLYKALAEKPATAVELAERTGPDPRYLRGTTQFIRRIDGVDAPSRSITGGFKRVR